MTEYSHCNFHCLLRHNGISATQINLLSLSSTLQSMELHISTSLSSWDVGPLEAVFHLNNTFTPPSDTRISTHSKMNFHATELIAEGNSRVFRGTLSGDGVEEIKVVCKLSVAPSLQVERRYQHEASVYENELHELQGRYIPKFYGLYTGTLRSSPAMCLLLEDCGESVNSIDALGMEWRFVSYPWCIGFSIY